MASSANSTSQQRVTQQPVSQQSASQQSGSPSPEMPGRVGHTVSWKVDEHLTVDQFDGLQCFCALYPKLDMTIKRHQLKMAIQRTSKELDMKMRLVRRDVVDATDKGLKELPVVATVKKKYGISRGSFVLKRRNGKDPYRVLRRHYEDTKEIIHTTVAAEIVKRYVRDSLNGFPIRAMGGTYFVSVKREQRLLQLSEYLDSKGIGRIMRFSVGGNEHETSTLSDEIRAGVEQKISEIREAFDESDLDDPRDRKKLNEKVRGLRGELAQMQDLFGFAKRVLKEKDQEARGILKEIVRGKRDLDGPDLFTDSGEDDWEECRTAAEIAAQAAEAVDGPDDPAGGGPVGDGASQGVQAPDATFVAA